MEQLALAGCGGRANVVEAGPARAALEHEVGGRDDDSVAGRGALRGEALGRVHAGAR